MPSKGLSYIRYVLTQDYIYGNHLYERGRVFVYTVPEDGSDGQWELINDKEFLFVEKWEQVPGYDYDSLYTPKNARYTGSNASLKTSWMYTEAGNIWLDDFNISADSAITSLANKWFISYLVIDRIDRAIGDTETEERVRTYIQMSNERT